MDIRAAIEAVVLTPDLVHEPPPNESCTCEWVILPLLHNACGYARTELLSRSADANNHFPDYTVLPKNELHRFFLEAKAWSEELQDSHAVQALNYANQNGRRWVVLTNGRTWRLYDNDVRGVAETKLVCTVNTSDIENLAVFLNAIGKQSVLASGLSHFAEKCRLERERREDTERREAERAARNERLFEYLKKSIRNPNSSLFGSIATDVRTQPELAAIDDQSVSTVLGWLIETDAEELSQPSIREENQTENRTMSVPSTIGQEFYFYNIGEGARRTWDDYLKYNYIGAGHGTWYRDGLQRLKRGDLFFAYMKGQGYLGLGRVTKPARTIKDFVVEKFNKKLLDCVLIAPNAGKDQDDPDLAEYAVGIEWIKTYPKEQAKTFRGAFASQHIVCRLSHPETLKFLISHFGDG